MLGGSAHGEEKKEFNTEVAESTEDAEEEEKQERRAEARPLHKLKGDGDRQETFSLRSRRPRRKSARRARSAAGTAPAGKREALTQATPRKMKVPGPPAPMAAGVVACPVWIVVALRIAAGTTARGRGR